LFIFHKKIEAFFGKVKRDLLRRHVIPRDLIARRFDVKRPDTDTEINLPYCRHSEKD